MLTGSTTTDTQEPRGTRARLAAIHAAPQPARRGMWEISYGHPAELTDACRPTVLSRVVDEPTWHQLHRGACLGCDYEGPERRRNNEATEDAHDHAWPTWRALPVVSPPAAAADYRPVLRERWQAEVTRAYPAGWFTSGGPLVIYRPEDGRHRPGGAPGGGYEIVVRQAEPSQQSEQPTLF
ncbi:DUF6349 family protein [Nonomuraea sediminis]|uniref:DUF6349 family protein n=1 Tax=Nonomuraea sediminis TaxID=2835864 RepID=UPI001BDC99A6|nr:DUF6349 family protein [Nonomuraea sediminis]